jgi:hypothetical protein
MGNIIVQLKMVMSETICMHTKYVHFLIHVDQVQTRLASTKRLEKNDTVQFICLQLNQV